MRRREMKYRVVRLALLLGLLLAATVVTAQAPYYQGKTISLIVPFSSGGGTDRFARTIAPYLEKHVPGNPRVLVENQPGGGGLIATNSYVLNTPADGNSLLVGAAAHTLRIMLGLKGSKVDLDRLRPLLGVPTGQVVYASTSTGMEEARDLLASDEPLFFGYHDPLGYVEAILSLAVLGVDYSPVSGYGGKGEVGLAFERGEVNLDAQNTQNYEARVQPLIEAGNAVPLFTVGRYRGGEFVRDPVAPELPTVFEVYEQVNGEAAKGPVANTARIVMAATTGANKPLWIHSDAPEEAVQALRQGIAAMAQDSEFGEALLGLGAEELLIGDELDQALDVILSMDPETQEWVRDFFGDRFGVEFETDR
jgi:hypothetical protein